MNKTNYPLKQLYICFFLLAGLGMQVNAQSGFSFSQDTVIADLLVSPTDTNPVFEHQVTVTTTLSKITLSWKVIATDVPKAWNYQVCDRLQCYGEKSLKDEKVKTSPEFDPDTTGLFKPGVKPRGLVGQGTMKIIVWDVNNTSDIDTLVVIYDAVLGLSPTLFKPIDIFPNPAQHHLSLDLGEGSSKITEVKAIDVLGHDMNVPYTQTGNRISINIEGLKNGTYVLQPVDTDGTVYSGRFTKL